MSWREEVIAAGVVFPFDGSLPAVDRREPRLSRPATVRPDRGPILPGGSSPQVPEIRCADDAADSGAEWDHDLDMRGFG